MSCRVGCGRFILISLGLFILLAKALAASDREKITPACVDLPFTFQVREWTTNLGSKLSFTWPEGVNVEPVP